MSIRPTEPVDMEGANEQTEEGATPNANVGTIVCHENNACDTANDQKDKKEPDDVDSVDLEDFDEFIEKPEPGKGTRNAKERTHPELLKGVGDAGGLDYSTEPTMAEFLEAAEKDELSETEEIKNAVARQRRDQERRAETKRDHELTIESKKREAPGMYGAPKEKTVIDDNKQHTALGLLTVKTTFLQQECGLGQKSSDTQIEDLKNEMVVWMESSEPFSGARRKPDHPDRKDDMYWAVHNSAKTAAWIRWALDNNKSEPWKIEIRRGLAFEWTLEIEEGKAHSTINRVMLTIRQERSAISKRILIDSFNSKLKSVSLEIAARDELENFSINFMRYRMVIKKGSMTPWRLQQAERKMLAQLSTISIDITVLLLDHRVA